MTGTREESPPGARRRGRPGPGPETLARAAELRAEGKADRAVAAELGVSHRQVARWLGSSGRGPGAPRAAADPREVALLREEPVTQQRTLSWREIGRRLGISHETARQRYASKEAAVNDLERPRLEDDLD